MATSPLLERIRRGVIGEGATLAASQAEVWRQGHRRDVRARPRRHPALGFTPAEVGALASIWHGTAEPGIFPGMAGHLAQVMPHASLTMLPGEGHLLLFTHWADICASSLSSRLRPRTTSPAGSGVTPAIPRSVQSSHPRRSNPPPA